MEIGSKLRAKLTGSRKIKPQCGIKDSRDTHKKAM
jgi:hypothetical protein